MISVIHVIKIWSNHRSVTGISWAWFLTFFFFHIVPCVVTSAYIAKENWRILIHLYVYSCKNICLWLLAFQFICLCIFFLTLFVYYCFSQMSCLIVVFFFFCLCFCFQILTVFFWSYKTDCSFFFIFIFLCCCPGHNIFFFPDVRCTSLFHFFFSPTITPLLNGL